MVKLRDARRNDARLAIFFIDIMKKRKLSARNLATMHKNGKTFSLCAHIEN